eukprot:1849346-Prymnesium_polylepis.1
MLHLRTSMWERANGNFQNFLIGLRGNVYFPWEFQWKVKGPLVEIGWWKSTPFELDGNVRLPQAGGAHAHASIKVSRH